MVFFLRVDWQTFNFKAIFARIEQLREEKGVPALLGKVLREGDQEILKYKGILHIEHVVTPALEKWAREQVESGLVGRGRLGSWDIGAESVL